MAVKNLDDAKKIDEVRVWIDLLVDASVLKEIVKECALSEWMENAPPS